MPSQGHPLSFAQQRLWFLDRLSPGIAFYNVPQVLELDGPLDVESLTRAVGEIVRRHEPLRTVFPSADGRPHQEVLPYQPFTIAIEDLSSAHDQEAQARLEQHVQDEIRRPFNLATGPIIRSSLVRMGPDRHVLIIVIHHISFDGWSIGLFFRELAALYDAFSTARPSPLQELPTRYVDFAVRQRELMTGETFERQMAFWREQLKPPRPVLALPSDRPRPAVQTHRGWQHLTVIPEAMFSALQDLSRREGVTVFMTLLAAYATFLQRLTGQDDVLIGTPIANRTTQDVEPLIGFFANSLTIRLDVSGDPPFRSLLQHARRVAIGAYTNQDLPFERIVEALNPERALSHTPIVQTFLVLDNNPNSIGEIMSTAGLMMRRKLVTTGTSKFDLTTSVRRAEVGRRIVVEASADLFDPETVGRMLRMFVRLLEGIVENADRPIQELPLLPDEDRRRILVEWNDTARPYPAPDTVVGVFQRQVNRSPDAIAVVSQNDRRTYGELSDRATRIACRLGALGVGPDDRIALCLHRSVALVEWMLGVLLAGGAYLPLDPSYPRARLTHILEDARARVVVTDQALASQVAQGNWVTVVIDDDGADNERPSGDRDLPPVPPESLAYVVYTSGSTGRPKGVAMEHRQVLNLVHWALDVFGLDERAGMLAATPIGFDVSVFELLVPLCGGTTIVLVEDTLALVRQTLPTPVTFVNSVPSIMSEILRVGPLPPSVTVVALAGEALDQGLVRRIYDNSSVERVFDLYGPSETHVATAALRTRDGRATIGRPIANMQAFVLDRSGELCPVGVPGELFLAGAGVARGYLGLDDLTNERFVGRTFNGGPERRAYRTGDLVRWQSEGTLEFLGRMDDQVKIHGVRVELHEIDEVLREHPAVADAVTVKRDDGTHARLVAYVVLREALAAGVLRTFVEARLPRPMVPSDVVVLARFPRLPTGKVDRAQLPVPPTWPPPGISTVPATAIELELAALWAEILGVSSVGVDQRFFDLGGHSLLAIRLFAEISSRFGVDLPLASLFPDGTVRRQAQLIDRGPWTTPWSPVVPIQPLGTRLPFFLVHGVGGEVLSFGALAGSLGLDQPTYGLHADLSKGAAFFSSVEDVAATYVRGVRAVRPTGPYAIGGYSSGGVIALEMARQLSAAGERVAALVMLDSLGPGASRQRRLTLRQIERMIRNAFYWPVDDDFFRMTPQDKGARLKSKLAGLLRGRSPHGVAGATDVRDELALWRMPESTLEYLNAHIRMIRAYSCHPYDGAIQLVRARTRRLMSRAGPDLGWRAIALGGVTVREVPGAHDTILTEPRVKWLAAAVAEALRHGRPNHKT